MAALGKAEKISQDILVLTLPVTCCSVDLVLYDPLGLSLLLCKMGKLNHPKPNTAA